MRCHIFLYSLQLNGLLFQEFPQAPSFSVGYTLAYFPVEDILLNILCSSLCFKCSRELLKKAYWTMCLENLS